MSSLSVSAPVAAPTAPPMTAPVATLPPAAAAPIAPTPAPIPPPLKARSVFDVPHAVSPSAAMARTKKLKVFMIGSPYLYLIAYVLEGVKFHNLVLQGFQGVYRNFLCFAALGRA